MHALVLYSDHCHKLDNNITGRMCHARSCPVLRPLSSTTTLLVGCAMHALVLYSDHCHKLDNNITGRMCHARSCPVLRPVP